MENYENVYRIVVLFRGSAVEITNLILYIELWAGGFERPMSLLLTFEMDLDLVI